jgi:hypothetical protein
MVIQRLRALLKKEDAEHRPVDVNEIVQDSLRLMHSDLLSRRVEVIADYAADIPLVSADRVQLSQVMLNFVMNACEAIDETNGRGSWCFKSAALSRVGGGRSGPRIEPAELRHIRAVLIQGPWRGTRSCHLPDQRRLARRTIWNDISKYRLHKATIDVVAATVYVVDDDGDVRRRSRAS